MKRYADFDLLVGKSGRGFRAKVLHSPAGEGDETRLPASLAGEMDRLVDLLERAARGEEPAQTARRAVEDLGGKLYQAVFSEGVGRRLEASLYQTAERDEGLRLRLRLTGSPRLSRWPWEYLYNAQLGRFLALSDETPIVRFPEIEEGRRPLSPARPLTVLAAIPSPRDRRPLAAAEREWSLISQALAALAGEGRIQLDRLQPATLEELGHRLRRGPVHVLHFIGHGEFDADEGEGALLFEDGHGRASRVYGRRLGATLLRHDLRLAVLDACEGARHGEADSFSGVAQRLLQQRVPAVVAMQTVIGDRAAVTFAERFYGALAEGEPVEAAVAHARLAMDQGGHGIQWGAPALYLRAPDGDLFDLGRAGAVAVPGEPPPETPEPAPRRARAVTGASIAAALLLAAGLGWLVESHREPVAATSRGPLVRVPAQAQPAGGPRNAAGRSMLGPPSAERARAAPPAGSMKPLPVPRSTSCPSPKSVEILFVRVEPGEFDMGSEHGGKPNERPLHRVRITRPFCLAAYEITAGEWDAVMGDRHTATTRERSLPKGGVTWDDTQRFVERLNAQNPGRRFWLPTEAEWEYAARAGSAASYSFGDDPAELYRYGNCRSRGAQDDGYDGPAPIGTFQPNAWGLYDMQGNVWEWVADRYGGYDGAPAVDPTGPATGDLRVRRGGAWSSAPESCRLAHRSGSAPTYHRTDGGFRIAAAPAR